jgi:hypothetical protein
MSRSRALVFLAKEFREMIPPTLFFMVGFNLIVLTSHLVIDDYRRELFNHMLATTSALVVGKSVLLANALPFLRRFDGAPLIAPILFKTLAYFTAVLIVRLLEEIVEYWLGGGSLSGTLTYVQEQFAWRRFAAVQIWICVLFLIYATFAELSALFGKGELRRIFFKYPTVNLKIMRRTGVETNEELRDRASLAQVEQAGGAAQDASRPDPRTVPSVTHGDRAPAPRHDHYLLSPDPSQDFPVPLATGTLDAFPRRRGLTALTGPCAVTPHRMWRFVLPIIEGRSDQPASKTPARVHMMMQTVRPMHAWPLGAVLSLTAMFSGDLSAQTVPSAEPGWSFSVTPYVWAPSVEGDLRYNRPGPTGGASSAGVSMDATNILEALNFAAMVAAEARNGRFSILTDFIYLDLGKADSAVQSVDFVQVGRNPVSTSFNEGTKSSVSGSLWTLGGAYTLANGDWGHVDAFAGFRLFSIEARTDVRLAADIVAPGGERSFARTGRLTRDADLFDGLVGLRGRFVLGSGFYLPYAFDIGAGSSRLTWQAAGGLGYQTGSVGVTLGYRHIYYDQGGDKLLQDFSFSGPFLALNIKF